MSMLIYMSMIVISSNEPPLDMWKMDNLRLSI